ncbi:hypothetical protein BKA62DRAFT_672679 [Auriculariales sp. MPI-PUGE-AT-0066]|nr:hypothetical protein BKA62DRAFT_672679 [Auriculariales sp. MPI-PUGE-AT-0066]
MRSTPAQDTVAAAEIAVEQALNALEHSGVLRRDNRMSIQELLNPEEESRLTDATSGPTVSKDIFEAVMVANVARENSDALGGDDAGSHDPDARVRPSTRAVVDATNVIRHYLELEGGEKARVLDNLVESFARDLRLGLSRSMKQTDHPQTFSLNRGLWVKRGSTVVLDLLYPSHLSMPGYKPPRRAEGSHFEHAAWHMILPSDNMSVMIASGIYPGARTEGLTTGGCDPAGEAVKEGEKLTATFFLGDTGVGMGLHMAGTDMGSAMQGTLVQYRVFPAAALVRIPDGLSYEEAATFSCAGGGWRPVRPGETVLVQGMGGVALFGAQIARASGARVVITSSSDTKLAQIQKLVPETVNYTTHPEWQERVLALTGGGGAHHVLDIGGAATVPRSLQAVAFDGCVSIIGSMTGVKLEWDLVSVIQKGAIVRGIPVGTRQHLEETFRLYEIRGIKPVVGIGFGEAKEALKTLGSQDFIGKIVIKVAA